MLIGTVWRRTQGSHSPMTGIIDHLNNSGPRLKLHDGSHRRLKWMELDFGWLPDDTRSEKQYRLWQTATHIEYLDAKIESEIKVTNGNAPVMTEPEVGVKECHGAWHRKAGKKGQPPRYELVPLANFDIATRGPYTGQLGAVCRDCVAKTNRSPSHQPKSAKFQIRQIPPPVEIEPVVVTPEGVTYRWKVTVVQPTEHYVQAKDFLDAAAQVAALGEVTRVEKL